MERGIDVMKQNPLRVTFTVIVMAAATISVARDAPAQESGTLLFQTATVKKDASVPVFRFQVASGKINFWPTDILLEIGREGNATTPPADPVLPAGVIFRIKRIDVAGEVTFPLAGGSSPGIPTKLVAVTRGLEVPQIVPPAMTPALQGLFAIQILANTGTSTTEQWEIHVENLTGSWRIIASIDGGYFNGVTPAPAVCGGGTTTTTCPPGQSCREPCGYRHCPRFPFYDYVEFFWPPLKGPIPCIRCSPLWKLDFDRNRFEREFVTWVPTDSQRIALDRAGGGKSVRFTVTGGEVIGDLFEGNGGEFIGLVQYPKGQPPLVAISAAGRTVGEFRAVPPKPDAETQYDNLAYGLGGLILGAVGGLLTRMRGGARPGDTKGPPGTKPV
jgi:hypothetical protein